MSLKPEDFSPTGSNWFFPTLEYVGRCMVEFSSPPGSVEGHATVSVDEAGDVTVEMVPEPDSLQNRRPDPVRIKRILQREGVRSRGRCRGY